MRPESKRYKRHATQHRGLTYRERAKRGARTYYGFVAGKQVPVGSNERDALAKYSELRAKSARGEQVVPTQLKFGTVAEEWYASKEKRLRRWTLVNYRAALDNVLLPRFGNFKLAQILSPTPFALAIGRWESRSRPAWRGSRFAPRRSQTDVVSSTDRRSA